MSGFYNQSIEQERKYLEYKHSTQLYNMKTTSQNALQINAAASGSGSGTSPNPDKQHHKKKISHHALKEIATPAKILLKASYNSSSQSQSQRDGNVKENVQEDFRSGQHTQANNQEQRPAYNISGLFYAERSGQISDQSDLDQEEDESHQGNDGKGTHPFKNATQMNEAAAGYQYSAPDGYLRKPTSGGNKLLEIDHALQEDCTEEVVEFKVANKQKKMHEQQHLHPKQKNQRENDDLIQSKEQILGNNFFNTPAVPENPFDHDSQREQFHCQQEDEEHLPPSEEPPRKTVGFRGNRFLKEWGQEDEALAIVRQSQEKFLRESLNGMEHAIQKETVKSKHVSYARAASLPFREGKSRNGVLESENEEEKYDSPTFFNFENQRLPNPNEREEFQMEIDSNGSPAKLVSCTKSVKNDDVPPSQQLASRPNQMPRKPAISSKSLAQQATFPSQKVPTHSKRQFKEDSQIQSRVSFQENERSYNSLPLEQRQVSIKNEPSTTKLKSSLIKNNNKLNNCITTEEKKPPNLINMMIPKIKNNNNHTFDEECAKESRPSIFPKLVKQMTFNQKQHHLGEHHDSSSAGKNQGSSFFEKDEHANNKSKVASSNQVNNRTGGGNFISRMLTDTISPSVPSLKTKKKIRIMPELIEDTYDPQAASPQPSPLMGPQTQLHFETEDGSARGCGDDCAGGGGVVTTQGNEHRQLLSHRSQEQKEGIEDDLENQVRETPLDPNEENNDGKFSDLEKNSNNRSIVSAQSAKSEVPGPNILRKITGVIGHTFLNRSGTTKETNSNRVTQVKNGNVFPSSLDNKTETTTLLDDDFTQTLNSSTDDFIRMTEIDPKLIGRQSRGRRAKRCLVYPDDNFKVIWEFLTTSCIVLTCLLTPYYLAFPEDYGYGMSVLDNLMNSIFIFDIFFNFFTAYYDNDYQIIDQRKVIAKKYFRTWFLIDVSSVIPFDQLYAFGNINKISRFTRIGKIYKLVKMMKIVRLVKIVKVNNKLVRNMSDLLKIGAGTERLLFLVLSFVALQHVTSCLWIFIAQLDDLSKNNWIYRHGYQDMENADLYITSFYFTVTTLVTVGYGDITAHSQSERIMCMFLMIIGVVTFSFTTGSLSSIITSHDSKEAQLKEKIATLNEISNEYLLDIDLFNKLAKTVKYDHSKKQKDTIQFMEELPHKLKLELAMVIHKSMYTSVLFFKEKDKSFIAWVARLIRPMNIEDQDYLYKEGDEIFEMYFLVKGSIGYVLPRFENKIYMEIKPGEHFGHTDLGNEKEFVEGNRAGGRVTFFSKEELVRRFTTQAFANSEMLALSFKDLIKMKLEFPKVFTELFLGVRRRLNKELSLKLEMIRQCEEATIEHSTTENKLKSKFTIRLLKGLTRKFNEGSSDDENKGKVGGKIGKSPLLQPYDPSHRIRSKSTMQLCTPEFMANIQEKSSNLETSQLGGQSIEKSETSIIKPSIRLVPKPRERRLTVRVANGAFMNGGAQMHSDNDSSIIISEKITSEEEATSQDKSQGDASAISNLGRSIRGNTLQQQQNEISSPRLPQMLQANHSQSLQLEKVSIPDYNRERAQELERAEKRLLELKQSNIQQSLKGISEKSECSTPQMTMKRMKTTQFAPESHSGADYFINEKRRGNIQDDEDQKHGELKSMLSAMMKTLNTMDKRVSRVERIAQKFKKKQLRR